MRKIFVQTKSVTRFFAAMNSLEQMDESTKERMVLLFGEWGHGKTEAAIDFVNRNNESAVFIRAVSLMSGRWLLEAILSELGETPRGKSSDIFRSICDQLMSRRRIVIIDEIDYLAYEPRVLQIIMDLHDICQTPFILIGMAKADQKLRRYGHFFDRFVDVIEFGPLDKDDVRLVCKQKTDLDLDDSAVKLLTSATAGSHRKLNHALRRAERLARVRGLKKLTAEDLAAKGPAESKRQA